MLKKLSITVDAEVYDGLHTTIDRRKISRFLSGLARPHVVGRDLTAGYAAMAANPRRRNGRTRCWATAPIVMADDPAPRRGEVWLIAFDPATGAWQAPARFAAPADSAASVDDAAGAQFLDNPVRQNLRRSFQRG